MDTSDRVAVIIIRVWEPAGEPGALRARMTQVSDLASGTTVTAAASDHGAIVAQLDSWLAAFERRPPARS